MGGVAKIHLKAKEQLNESGLDLENEEMGKDFFIMSNKRLNKSRVFSGIWEPIKTKLSPWHAN